MLNEKDFKNGGLPFFQQGATDVLLHWLNMPLDLPYRIL